MASAGLVAALALIQRGFEVRAYEQAPELREFGGSISPNGLRVLVELGLQSAFEQVASRPTNSRMRLFNSEKSRPLGSSLWVVHRGDLHQALALALEKIAPGAVLVGARCIGFEQSASEVTLLLDNGERVHGDALVGADGVHSRIRRELFGEGRATFTGFMDWSAVVPIERAPLRLREPCFPGWVGPSGQVVTYPVRHGRLMNLAGRLVGGRNRRGVPKRLCRLA